MRPYHYWIAAAAVAGAAHPPSAGTRGGAAPAAPVSGNGSRVPARSGGYPRSGWMAPAAASSLLPDAGAAPAAHEALDASEDVAILKALAPLQLTRSQLSDLLPALQSAQAKLTELDTREAARLAAWKSSLEQARRDLLAGKGNGARASDQFALAQWGSEQKRASLRADLVSSLRASLEKILTPAQAAQVAASGQAVLLTQRMAGWRGGGPGGWRQAGSPPGTGGPGGTPDTGGPGGPGGRGSPADRLDRIRQMSPADFQQFAARAADRFGGESAPQFQQFTEFMNQLRNMPQSQYVLQRDQLAAQSFGRGPGGFGAALGNNNGEATKAFVDRYLLSPRAPIVVRERLRSDHAVAD